MAIKTDGMTVKELYEERADLIAESRKLIDTAESEKRDLSDEETRKFDEMSADIDVYSEAIDKKNGDEERRSRLDRWSNLDGGDRREERRQPGNDGSRSDGKPFKIEWRDNLFGGERRTVEFRKDDPRPSFAALYERAQPEYEQAFRSLLTKSPHHLGETERRALQADSQTDGGYLVPTQFVARLIKFVDDMLFIRQFGTVFPLATGDSVGFPSLDTDPADFDWTTELQTGSEDSTMAFGKRELAPHPLAKRIKVSNKLLRVAALNPEDLVLQRLGYKMAVTEEKAFLTGTGNQQPLGLFTASNDGISTSRDVSTGNTTTTIKADGLIEAKYSLKGQYHMRARWIFHRDAIKQIAKLKDGEGQYLWQPGLQAGQPDRLLNMPLSMSEFAPNTFTTGLYVGLLGDLSHYWIADSLQMSMQRLVELYAETNQVGFIGRKETDAMPVLEEAFARVTLA